MYSEIHIHVLSTNNNIQTNCLHLFFNMGNCLLAGESTDAEKAIEATRRHDLSRAIPVFDNCDIKKVHIQNRMHEIYEQACGQGYGNLHYLMADMRINRNDEHFFLRTFAVFDVHRQDNELDHENGHGKHQIFTFPQYCFCMWNFLTLDLHATTEWMFRAYFGGIECGSRGKATTSHVFHLIDVIYGLSKNFNVGHDSDFVEKLLRRFNLLLDPNTTAIEHVH